MLESIPLHHQLTLEWLSSITGVAIVLNSDPARHRTSSSSVVRASETGLRGSWVWFSPPFQKFRIFIKVYFWRHLKVYFICALNILKVYWPKVYCLKVLNYWALKKHTWSILYRKYLSVYFKKVYLKCTWCKLHCTSNNNFIINISGN